MLFREGSRYRLALPRLGLLAVAAAVVFAGRPLFAGLEQPADYYDQVADGPPGDTPLLAQAPSPAAPATKPAQPGNAAPKATQPTPPNAKPPQPNPPRPTPPPVNPPSPPGPLSQPTPNLGTVPTENMLAANDLGTGNEASYSLAGTPGMIGDFFNGGGYSLNIESTGKIASTVSIPLAGGDRSPKISDDSSPIPTDRFFFDDNYYNHAVQTGNGAVIGLNRATFGAEKTFNGGLWSIEIRAPVETGLASDQSLVGSPAGDEGTLFGDMSITPKILLYQNDTCTLALGLMIGLPTAPDASFNFLGDTINIQNRAVYLEPFVGVAYAPNERLFSISYIQLSFDEGGDPVSQSLGSDQASIGNLRDPSLLNVDISVGYWLFHNTGECACGSYLTGVAPIIELHYTTTMEHFQGVGPADDQLITPLYDGEDILNLTAGLHFAMGPCSCLTVAGVVPLRTTDRDKEFDSEALVEFNRHF